MSVVFFLTREVFYMRQASFCQKRMLRFRQIRDLVLWRMKNVVVLETLT